MMDKKMPLITCPDCKKEMSDLAPACPHCGKPFTSPPDKRRVGFWLGLGIVLVPLIFVWFTLRKGHTGVSRFAGFSWLFLTTVLFIVDEGKNSEKVMNVETKETIKSHPPINTNIKSTNDSSAIAKVRATQKSPKGSTFLTAPYRGGVAVLANNTAGYWVYQNTVYATNGVAGSWSQDIVYSPPSIDQQDIKEAITEYHKNGTINSEPINTKIEANLDNLISFSATTIAEKKGYNFYIGGDENHFCDISVTADLLLKNKGVIKTKVHTDEFSASCNWDEGYFVFGVSGIAHATFKMEPDNTGKYVQLSLEGLFIENGKQGRLLSVKTTGKIILDETKAIK